MRRPGIVALEGIDGSGKSTQAKLLADHLDELDIAEHYIGKGADLRPPCMRQAFPDYSTETGKIIKDALRGGWEAWAGANYKIGELPVTEARGRVEHDRLNATVLQSLMLANKLELAGEIEYANVVHGQNMVLDRYIASGIAYGAADGLDPEWIEQVHERLPKAHHVLVDIPVEVSFERRPQRTDAYEADKDRLGRARQEYLALFERHGVDMTDWDEEKTMLREAGWTASYRSSPSGWAVVNGVGTEEQVHARILAVLSLSKTEKGSQ